VDGVITKAPRNAIGLETDKLLLECEVSGTSVAIEWIWENGGIAGINCTTFNKQFSTAEGGSDTDCTLIVQGVSGPFTCYDSQSEIAEAAVIIIR